MSRLRQTLTACLLAMSAAATGCAHCTTCGDFPSPGHPTGYAANMGSPMNSSPMSYSSPTTGPVDASVSAPPTAEASPSMDTATDTTPPAPQLPIVNP